MGPRTLEGTWEEIARHGPELAGRKVRLTVLDERGPASTLDRVLAPLLASAEHLAGERRPAIPSSSAPDWSDGVVEKYRRQGFTL